MTKRSGLRVASAVALLAAAGLSTQASVIPRMSVSEVLAASDAVVHGLVTDQESRWEEYDGNRLIFTYTTIDVFSSSFTPIDFGPSVTVRTVGGADDTGFHQTLEGEASLSRGEQVVLFLETPDGWSSMGVTGFFNGKFRVENSGDGSIELVRDAGQQVGRAARAGGGISVDSFLAQLGSSERGAPPSDGIVPLIPMDGESFTSAALARSLERGVANTDVNADGSVDKTDVQLVLRSFGSADTEADVDADGTVGMSDLVGVIRGMGAGR